MRRNLPVGASALRNESLAVGQQSDVPRVWWRLSFCLAHSASFLAEFGRIASVEVACRRSLAFVDVTPKREPSSLLPTTVAWSKKFVGELETSLSSIPYPKLYPLAENVHGPGRPGARPVRSGPFRPSARATRRSSG